MRQRVRRLAWLCALLLGTVRPAQSAPADQYILRTTPGTSVAEILARHSLKLRDVVDDDHDHGIFLVQASDTLPAPLVEGEVEADAAVLGFEALRDVRLPEARRAQPCNSPPPPSSMPWPTRASSGSTRQAPGPAT